MFILEKITSIGHLIGPFLLLLGVLIFIHEWGHFIVARICGVRVETFSIGFGPKIFQKKWGDTTYCLSIIPLGGYVKMFGDDITSEVPKEEQPESFIHQSLKEKIAIVAAGPIMNLIFAFGLFVALGAIGSPQTKPIIGDVDANTPAALAGFSYGDTITSVNNTKVKSWDQFQKELNSLQSQDNIRVDVKRLDGTSKEILSPLKSVDNINPMSNSKTMGSIEGLSPYKLSSIIALNFDSILHEKKIETLDRVKEVNGEKINSFFELKSKIQNTPSSKNLTLVIQNNSKEEKSVEIIATNTGSNWSLEGLGIKKPELFIGSVVKGSPAFQAGIKPGFQILKINSVELKSWMDLVEAVKNTQEGQKINFQVADLNQEVKNIFIAPEITEHLTQGGQVDRRATVGIRPGLEIIPPEAVYIKQKGTLNLFKFGVQKSIDWTMITLLGFKKLLFGEISHKTLSGVITIGQVARQSLTYGWAYFIQMMAIISINLFLLNLMPVPVLDGGHLLFYAIEGIKGSPVNLKTRLIAQQVGVVILMFLIVFTIFNDISRIVFSG